MGDSDGAWGDLARHDDELAEVWDGFRQLPELGAHAPLDAFVERKHITHAALVRLGTRLAGENVLAFAFPGGIKFRDIVTDKRWSYHGSSWRELKIVRAGLEPSRHILVAEGETDGAWLSDHYICDVAILPAGADPRPHTQSYATQLGSYEIVLLAQDNDEAGDRGAAMLAELVPQAIRWPPPGEANDWCASEEPPADLPDDAPERPEAQLLVPAGQLLAIEPPEIASWYENALLPVGGQAIIHGWAKSFKSFLALDWLAALAQGQDWCCFEPTEEPCRVAVMQYEIPWAYYQQRIMQLRKHARDGDSFDTNFFTWRPLVRPSFVAGNTAAEDEILFALESASVQVFLLDPIRRATGLADLNSEKDVRPLLNFMARLQDNGVTVVLCHHDNKTYARSGGGNPLGMTGVGAFAGDADTIVSVAVPKGHDIESPKRNLHFTLRNAPSVPPRGMEMTEDGRIVYSPEPHGDWSVDDPDDTRPAI